MAGSELRIRVRDLKKHLPFSFESGEHHKVVLVRSKGFVLDAEDQHFGTDRCVLLPDVAMPNQPPVLDKRRLKGIDVIYAALVHAEANPSQGLMVAGHTDPSGKPGYNRRLSEARAENVSLLLRGKRDEWRKHAAKYGAVDDYQAVLKWQHRRSGWACDPGDIDGRRGRATIAAIRELQTQYNALVEAAKSSGLDSPFKDSITVDGKVGPQTWGAFYDLYASELMRLLELDAYAVLKARQEGLKPPPGMRDFVGCGEHVPLDPSSRDPYEKEQDEHLEGPPHHAADRRVEILFLDPGEEVDLPCKAKTTNCKPPECLLYGDHRFQLSPIGIPKGLGLLEANLRLTFVDPEGKTRPFPKGVMVEVRFGDPANFKDSPSTTGGSPAAAPPPADPDADVVDDLAVSQEPVVQTGEDGVVRFAVARQASTLFLRIVTGDKPYIVCKPDDPAAQVLASDDELAELVGAGRMAFQLPAAFTTLDGRWTPPAGVQFDRGMFTDIDNRKTQIGSRGSPVEMTLDVVWQYFRFDYYDRWTSSPASLPQPGAKDKDGKAAAPLVLEGHASMFAAQDRPSACEGKTAWHLTSGDHTVYCLGWARRLLDAKTGKLRELPDATTTVRFAVDEFDQLFVRTEGDGKDPKSPRALLLLDASGTTITSANAERLRHYDLPRDWRSTDYPARLASEAPDKVRPFQQVVASKSALGDPYVVSLDVVVLEGAKADEPDKTVVWDDSKLVHRFAIRDSKLAVWKPHPTESYFTKLDTLAPQPTSAVLCDVPAHARLITRGRIVYHAFGDRLPAVAAATGYPVGARLARRVELGGFGVEERRHFFHLSFQYKAPKPDGSTSNAASTGHSAMGLLRCCGHEGGVELFATFSYVTVACDFSPTSKPQDDAEVLAPAPTGANADEHVRKCLLATNTRWNGGDAHNPGPPAFEIGDPVIAKGSWTSLMVPGTMTGANSALLIISVFKKVRAGIQTANSMGHWALEDMLPTSGGAWAGYFTAAHELGHVMGQPDEYLNRDYEPSLGLPNITEFWRSPGTPYGLDPSGMMNSNREVRSRYYWNFALWAQDRVNFAKDPKIVVKHGTFQFTADSTPPAQSRVQWPLLSSKDANANPSASGAPWSGVAVGTLGLCDQFLYLTGKDGWTAGELGGSSPTPFDGFVVVRVKMGWRFTFTQKYDVLSSLLSRANDTIDDAFNRSHKLVFRGAFASRPVRLRVLFAPRFLSRTFPTGGKDATSYLEGIDYPKITPPIDESNHRKRVEACATAHGLHAEIEVVDKGTPGVTTTGSSPRNGIVRRDGSFLLIFNDPHFDDDVLRVFGQLVGLPDGSLANPLAFQPLVTAIPGLLAVPEYV